MDLVSIIKNLKSEDVQRYARIALQWIAAALVTRGVVAGNASWIEPAIGIGVALISFAWTLYGNRLQAKINELAKQDTVQKIVTTPEAATAAPSDKVVAK